MTDAEWLACSEPEPMLLFLSEQGRLSGRKTRLFAAACCRRIWDLCGDTRSCNAIHVAERLADGLASADETRHAREDADAAADEADDAELSGSMKLAMLGTSNATAFAVDTTVNPFTVAEWSVYALTGNTPVSDKDRETERLAAFSREESSQAEICRDIFGNPFRSNVIPASLLIRNNGLIVKLAQEAYDDRDLPAGTLHRHRLLALAEAFANAMTDARISGTDPAASVLEHLRDEKLRHWRGCVVVDGLLGKA
jgi:hypothetical protein